MNTANIITLLINKGESKEDFLTRCQDKAVSVDYKKMDFKGDHCYIYHLTKLPCTRNNS